MSLLSKILEYKLVAIIRGARPADALKIAGALQEGGIKVLEITLNSPDALSAISLVAEEMGSDLLVGAGTVLDGRDAEAAITAGAQFIISPTLDKETIRVTKEHGAVSIPGAFTATEILAAYLYGGDIIKVFPASVGAGYFKDLRGPLPHIPLMPTGGVNLSNIQEYQKAGAVAFGIGSALTDTSLPTSKEMLRQLTEKARLYVKAITLGVLFFAMFFAGGGVSANAQTIAAGPSGPIPGKSWNLPLKDKKILGMAWIAPGTFLMGSPASEPGHKQDEGPQKEVKLTKGYWLRMTEVTVRQWKAVTGIGLREKVIRMLKDDSIYDFDGKKQRLRDFMRFDPNDPEKIMANEEEGLPMYFVSWYEAMEFCKQLTLQERAGGRLPKGYAYTLPTEAEWEFACRAGTYRGFRLALCAVE